VAFFCPDFRGKHAKVPRNFHPERAMGVSIDLRRAHKHRKYGDITMILTWVNDERAMVLVPNVRTKAAWYIVCESAAWKYDDARYLATQCVKACEVLDIEPSKANWVRLATLINEALPDLIRMPTAQPPAKLSPNFGSMTMLEGGKVLAQDDIRLEDEGQEYV
jgi:hypothetical protein